MSATAVLPSQPAKCPLALQNIPRSTSASVEDKQGKLVAQCALVQCTKGQAYLIVQQLDASIVPKAVTVCAPDAERPLELKLSTIADVHPNRMHMPMYIQVHYNPDERCVLEHLVDLLAESVLGRPNLELRKNLTIDLFDSAADAVIRDGAGFIVADKHRLQQISVDAKQAQAVLTPSNEIVISSAPADPTELLEYDATLSSHQRADFLRFLLNECKHVLVAHWSAAKLAADLAQQQQMEEDKLMENEEEGGKRGKAGKKSDEAGTEKATATPNTVAGYLVASDERILCLYAENEKIADSLLGAYIDKTNVATITLCCAATQWTRLRKLSTLRTRPIYRRHTRMVPSNVKYGKLYALNIGMNIF